MNGENASAVLAARMAGSGSAPRGEVAAAEARRCSGLIA